MDWRLLVEERIANLGTLLPFFCRFDDFFWILIYIHFVGSLQTSLLCIMGELAGGGSAAVAVGVSDR